MSIEQTYSTVAATARKRLQSRYTPEEARWMTRIIFEQIKGFTPTDMIIKADKPCSDFIAGRVGETVDRLLKGEPIQYIFGTARFYGLDFRVTPDVLIPRPETEQLVDMIVDDSRSRSDLSILDIGTGSGCIACSLARTLPFADVTAIDISAKALAVARENADALKVKVDFLQADILKLAPPATPAYDIIVSNPPYILPSEAEQMEPNVLDHEPHSALFVPTDADGLLFVGAISHYSLAALKVGGALYLEINPLLASQVKARLQTDGWDDVEIIADERGRRRFAKAVNGR